MTKFSSMNKNASTKSNKAEAEMISLSSDKPVIKPGKRRPRSKLKRKKNALAGLGDTSFALAKNLSKTEPPPKYH